MNNGQGGMFQYCPAEIQNLLLLLVNKHLQRLAHFLGGWGWNVPGDVTVNVMDEVASDSSPFVSSADALTSAGM